MATTTATKVTGVKESKVIAVKTWDDMKFITLADGVCTICNLSLVDILHMIKAEVIVQYKKKGKYYNIVGYTL